MVSGCSQRPHFFMRSWKDGVQSVQCVTLSRSDEYRGESAHSRQIRGEKHLGVCMTSCRALELWSAEFLQDFSLRAQLAVRQSVQP